MMFELPARLGDDRILPLVSGNRGARNLDTHAVGDFDLKRLVVTRVTLP